ncbi:type 2 topoisomerase subunit B [Listeria phage LPJP1]|nr:type 2 topoisomerase subunit B [Listeria phage LPJP1]
MDGEITLTRTYSGEDIDVLEGLEAIQVRPDMYVGSSDETVNHLVKEAIDNGVDEFLNNFGTKVIVDLDTEENIITVIDDGRGLPTDIHPKKKIPTMQVLLSEVHSGAKFRKDSFKVSSGKNGVGIKAVNALSEYLRVISIREGYQYSMEFSNGKVTKEFKKEKQKEYKDIKHGTIIAFKPNGEFIDNYDKFDPEFIKDNLEKRAYSNANLKLIYKEKGKEVATYHHENGIRDYITILNNNPFTSNHYYKEELENGDLYEVTFGYSNSSDENIYSFVNGLKTARGTHETGFKMALTNLMTNYIKNNKMLPKNMQAKAITGEDIRSGLVCVINLKLQKTSYRSQTKDELSNPEVSGIIKRITNSAVKDIMDTNPSEFKKVCSRIIDFAKGRINASKYREKIVKDTNNLTLSSKFSDCLSKDPSEREIFLCEGDSASSGIKEFRISQTQAVFPLKGKPKNSYGLSSKSLLGNDEFNNIIKIIFGTNDIKNIDYDKVRYHKIIFTADSDTDGLHINSLLGLFFYTHFKELFDRGYIYIAMPPKYSTYDNVSKKFIYFKNDKELNTFKFNNIKKRIKLSDDSEFKLKDFINNMSEYQNQYNIVKQNNNNISDSVIDTFLLHGHESNSFIEKILLDRNNYRFSKNKNGNIIGMHDNAWHDINIDLLNNDISRIKKVMSISDLFEFTDTKTNEIYSNVTLKFLMDYINSKFTYKLNYFKGLGEANPEELFDTTIDPEKRDLIQVRIDPENEESTQEITDIFFKNNSTQRKEYVNSWFNIK